MNFFAFDRITLCLWSPDSVNYVSLTQLPFRLRYLPSVLQKGFTAKCVLQEKIRGIQDMYCLKYSWSFTHLISLNLHPTHVSHVAAVKLPVLGWNFVMILALRQIRTSVIECHLVSRDRNLSGSFLYREFCKILKKVKKLHAWKGEFRFRIRKLSSHDRHCVGFVCINDIIELGTGMPVILNPETMGCGFLFAVKILASNVVNQSKRNVLPIKELGNP